ncbi:MAG: NUDIX hydrolase [Dehalococcoidia bacterium]
MSTHPSELPAERTIESHRVYEGQVVNLRLDTVERADGRRLRREVVEHGEVVAIVPIEGDGRVLLVRQHRTPVGQVTLEIPAGGVDSGESPAEAAQRELREETGRSAGRLERLLGFYASPGHCSEYIHLFLAHELSPAPAGGDQEETVAVEALPLDDALTRLEDGGINDGKSIIGLLLAASERSALNQI